MQFKIPYERNKISEPTIEWLNLAIENKVQIPYQRKLVRNGMYREWITRMDEETLHRFINENEDRMQRILDSTAYIGYPDKQYEELLYRNCLYHVELFLRHSDDMEKLDEELFDYHQLWIGRLNRMKRERLLGEPVNTGINPYY